MRFDTETNSIQLPVRELCLLALRGGDLDLRPGARGIGLRRAAEGQEAHRLLQERRAADGTYEAEVTLSDRVTAGGLTVELSGRADGVLHRDIPAVEEIKTVTGRVDRAPSAFHEAQGICYAWLLARREQCDAVEVRLTLYRPSDGKSETTATLWRTEELELRGMELLDRIVWRMRYLSERAHNRLPAAAACRFPYRGLREGQETLLTECYRDIRHGKRLFAEAPTGIGKTISTLYPAVRALGEGHCDRIFYLTAKASTRREAFRAAKDIYAAGGLLRTVILTSREQICPNRAAHEDPAGITSHCNPVRCPRAAGFYDRVPVALCDCLDHGNGFTRGVIEKTAQDYGICPYEFQLELSEFCDTLICDYNYVFDPMVYLRRYFAPDVTGERSVFLVDEAHNLVDRARGMYSAGLSLTAAEGAWLALSGEDGRTPEKAEALETLIRALRACRGLCRESTGTDADGVKHGYYLTHAGMERLYPVAEACRDFLSGLMSAGCNDPAVLALSAMLKKFSVIAECYDSHFLTFLERHGHEVTVRLVCLDPSEVLERVLERAWAAVFFSATLTPPDYFAHILGGGRGAVRLSLPSPFRPANLCLAAVTGVSTRFEDRAKNAKKIAACIAGTVSGKRGNYIVFFPSYAYLEQVLTAFREKYPSVEVIAQARGMGQGGKEDFLAHFADDGHLRVGFCVLGGAFSEGVDLPGGRLIGAVVVGVGLPGLSSERNILREYYDENGVSGYDYAYTYPGMNRVLQAVGRVIRREDDRGVAVLIDDRWGEDRFRRLFPAHWRAIQYAGNPRELADIVSVFWSSVGQTDKNEFSDK